jgi:hypothetical protein
LTLGITTKNEKLKIIFWIYDSDGIGYRFYNNGTFNRLIVSGKDYIIDTIYTDCIYYTYDRFVIRNFRKNGVQHCEIFKNDLINENNILEFDATFYLNDYNSIGQRSHCSLTKKKW